MSINILYITKINENIIFFKQLMKIRILKYKSDKYLYHMTFTYFDVTKRLFSFKSHENQYEIKKIIRIQELFIHSFNHIKQFPICWVNNHSKIVKKIKKDNNYKKCNTNNCLVILKK